MTAQLKGPPTYRQAQWIRMQVTLEAQAKAEDEAADDDVIGYHYAAADFHGMCLINIMCLTHGDDFEHTLNVEADYLGFDRTDETSFNSDAFPQRIKRRDANQHPKCHLCDLPLNETPT